ncbi:MAG: branched-chain amino acid ABC transporter permease [Deltaproteobacteria bacterium]|nr:branched-chain amino acid ABC transporter permease [Deltaproteobacteria bacterium]
MKLQSWLLIVLIACLGSLPLAVSNPYYLNVINIAGLNVIMAVGLNLLIGYAGQISLGHAAFFAMGAYISGILTARYGLPPWPALALAMTGTGLAAYLIGVPTMRLSGNYLVMATLGFNIIINIIINQWDEVTGGPSGYPGIPPFSIGSFVLDTDLRAYYLIWGSVLATMWLALNLVDSRVGRALRALHGSEVAAASLGVDTDQYKVKIFVFSACLASLAGSFYAHYLSFISPKTFNIFFSVELVTMVMVGGLASVWGSLLGAILLTPLPHLLHFFEEYKDVGYGLILVFLLIYRPQGLLVGLRWPEGKRPAERPAASKE